MDKDVHNLLEYFDGALQEIYSLEEMLQSFGQKQMADVLRSVVEMAYGKLSHLNTVLERDVGRVQIQTNEFGEPTGAFLSAKPSNESIQ
ncbi:MAG: hypothetical protein D6E12_07270 [Desulfovibrio sp.]|nr:MAG: hypothetical protein D6E12_07270 [Desulfovibrio sp.]